MANRDGYIPDPRASMSPFPPQILSAPPTSSYLVPPNPNNAQQYFSDPSDTINQIGESLFPQYPVPPGGNSSQITTNNIAKTIFNNVNKYNSNRGQKPVQNFKSDQERMAYMQAIYAFGRGKQTINNILN
jgi:hypothetical protein